MKITKSGSTFKLPDEFRIPGLQLEYCCPQCNSVSHIDASACCAEMSVNQQTFFSCFCAGCSYEWEEPVILRLQLEPLNSIVAV